MGRGIHGGRASGRPPAAMAAVLLALALIPLAAADDDHRPLQDTLGPTITELTVSPNPVVPPDVYVNATAVDLPVGAESPIAAAELFVDLTSPAECLFLSGLGERMNAVGAWGQVPQFVQWVDTYDLVLARYGPGSHTVFVHARDAAGNWGPCEVVTMFIGDATTVGPSVSSLAALPPDLPRGADVTINATIFDPFRGQVMAAEFFLDVPGPDGTGTPLDAADGAYGDVLENVTWVGLLTPPRGEHTIFVHGRNALGLWGVPGIATFTARAPAFTLRVAADRAVARPLEVVSYSIQLENGGNAVATAVWLNVTLPSPLAYLDDTVASVGGVNLGGTSYAFADVVPGSLTFALRARVAEDAVDGATLATAASMDYTNDQGWAFPPVSATASLSVVAPEVRLVLAGPATAFAGETAGLTIRLEQLGSRTIPFVDVTLGGSAWTEVVSDTASQAGGARTGPWSWRFADLAAGVHEFVVTERISAVAPDGGTLQRAVQATYVDRFGSSAIAQAVTSYDLSRPLFSFSVRGDRNEVVEGGRVTFHVDFANEGSAAAGTVWLNVTLPAGLGLGLGQGEPPTASSDVTHTWVRGPVAPGSERITVVLVGRAAGAPEAVFELAYASPNGVALDVLRVRSTVFVQPAPPPVAQIYVALAGVGAAVAAGGFLATERGKTALLSLLVPLYTRLRRDEILDHETRGMIRGYVLANPGDHFNAIKETLELPNGTLAYHLSVLEKETLVRSVKDGKFRRYYPSEMKVPEGGEPTKIQRVILELIRENPGITSQDAAGLLGLTPSTVSYHLDKLRERGRVEFRREGIAKRVYLRQGNRR